MDIRIGTDYRSFNGLAGAAVKPTEEADSGFKTLLGGLIDSANQAEAADQLSNIDLANGVDIGDLSATIIAAEKAELSLRLVLQIRNKVVDAYSEIMRMQV